MQEIKKHIDLIIDESFKTLRKCYNHKEVKNPTTNFDRSKSGSRLIFPMYGDHRGNETRISEQELRFVFVEEFNKYCDKHSLNWYYSVETPTMDKYKFKGAGSPMVGNGGQSASFDMVIHDKTGKRIALIEFKALNPDEFEYKKDYLKLKADTQDSVLRYFVMVLKSHDGGTLDNVTDKLTDIENDIEIRETVFFHCYSLEGNGGKGEIITLFSKCDH